MKLVIDISEEFYECIVKEEYDSVRNTKLEYFDLVQKIKNGVPLDSVLEDIKAEIEELPIIKVGNSNSPTVKYCIDERLIYEVFEKYISGKVQE